MEKLSKEKNSNILNWQFYLKSLKLIPELAQADLVFVSLPLEGLHLKSNNG